MTVGDFESHHQIWPGIVRQQEESASRPRGPGGKGSRRVARKGNGRTGQSLRDWAIWVDDAGGEWKDQTRMDAITCQAGGGTREGVMLRLSDDDLSGQLRALHGSDRFKALTFYAAPAQLDFSFIKRHHSEIAHAHAHARTCGHLGSGAGYLRSTVVHLEEMGIHDRYLRTLQEMVAEEIRSLQLGPTKHGENAGARTAVIGSGRTMPKEKGK